MPMCNFSKVVLFTRRHGCSPINLLHIFRTPFYKNTSEGLLPTLGSNRLLSFLNQKVSCSALYLCENT